jgi:glycosyltransferase involved in cell wall biosynthesis
MKIIIVGTAYPLRGGIAHYNALLAKHLGKKYNVETVTFKRQYPAFLFPGKTQSESSEAGGTDAAPQWIDSVNPINWYRVASRISQMKPDLLIFKYWLPFFGPCFGTIACRVKKQTGAKVLFICDNIIPHERRPGDIVFTKYAFKQVDYFIVQSDSVERDLLSLFPNAEYKKSHHPIYEYFGDSLNKTEARMRLKIFEERVILFFGYIRAYKGLMILIEALNEFRKWQSDFEKLKLLIVGEPYEDMSKYNNRIDELRLGSKIQIISDYVPNDLVALYFSAADVVVLPYISATQSGIVQIAYNFNKPVIVTDVGGLGEVVINGITGYVVPPNNPVALADAIRKFYIEGNEPIFSSNVNNEKKKYSWEHFVGIIEYFIKNK